MSIIQGSAHTSAGGYQIERSLRFNSADSAYLNRTPASATNRDTLTISLWHKRSALGSLEIICQQGADTNNSSSLIFNSSNQLEYNHVDSGSTTDQCITSAVFRDVGAWYHIVLAIDTTQATDTNRIKLYVNNVQQTLGTANYPAQNVDTDFNTTNGFRIGSQVSSTPFYLNGYLTEVNFIDGQALTPSDFGETDSATGVWKPKAFSGTYGTNGFYLKFADNSGTTSTTLGKDSSGNGNNWTPNNFSVTAGAGNDSLVDTPTSYGTDTGAGGEVRGNYATLNPLDNGGVTLSNGNLRSVNPASVQRLVRATIFPASGKWYWEAQADANCLIGVASAASSLTNFCGASADARGWYGSNGQVFQTGSVIATYASYTSSDVLGFALDVDAGTCQVYKNNVSQGTWTSLSGVTAAVGRQDGIAEFNFGQRPFAYTAPSGFKALCTQNLPTPTIGATSTTQANDYFNAVLYTGTGSSLSVTGVGFQPDFVWIKGRSGATDHGLYDAVRGVQKQLESNTTTAETTETTGLTAFNSDGFTVGALAQLNTNTDTYVAWNWKASGAGSTNTSGTITSTVSANTTSGFSIVTYTGNGTNGSTIGHGLGVAPSMIIVKSRSAADGWPVYHTSIANTQSLRLNTTAAVVTAGFWNNTTAGSSVFTVGGGSVSETNTTSATYVAYCFAAVAGYSAFGKYTGNGSTDGPMVWTGMRPRFVMVKRTDTASAVGWVIWDTTRGSSSGGNVIGYQLYPNLSTSESSSSTNLDILSNGFKLRDTYQDWNANGGTYIYAAFAESPFKYSLAR